MKLSLYGFEQPVELSAAYVRTLEVANKTLFTRVCRSLLSGEGADALVPYSVWDDSGEELPAKSSFLLVRDPLNLPWESKDLVGRLYERIEGLMMEDEDVRGSLERLGLELESQVLRLTHQVDGSYTFGSEWVLERFLKAFSFRAHRDEHASYLDNVIAFLDFASDMRLKKAIAFVNLKSFLEKNELEEVFQRTLFHGFEALLLESVHDSNMYELERKTCVDQHFLESSETLPAGCPSPSQGRF